MKRILVVIFIMIPLILFAGINKKLHEAAKNGNKKMVRILIKNGADIDAQDITLGWTAIMEAANKGHFQVVKLLITKGADLNIESKMGETVLMLAAINGHNNIIKILKKAGAGKHDDLIRAATNGDVERVKKILTSDVDINQQNEFKRTALMNAAGWKYNYYIIIVKLLIKNGADVNLKDKNGRTALMSACQGTNYKVVKLLLENGADVKAKNKWGKTALENTKEALSWHPKNRKWQRDHKRIIKLLEAAGAR